MHLFLQIERHFLVNKCMVLVTLILYVFLCFPRCKRWIINMRRQDLLDLKKEALDKRLKHMKVCSKHFLPSQFVNPKDW